MTVTTAQGLLISGAIPLAALALVTLAYRIGDALTAKPRSGGDGDQVVHIAAGRPAADLPALLDALPRQGSTLWLLGADCAALAPAIERWTRDGMEVHAVALHPNEHERSALEALARRCTGGRFQPLVLSEEDTRSAAGQAMARPRPALLAGPASERALWTAGLHREGAKVAYNVRYIPPRAMDAENAAETEHWCRRIKQMRTRRADLLATY